MGEHNQNCNDLLAATLPSLLQPGLQAGIRFDIGVAPKENVILAEGTRIRTLESGLVQLLAVGSSEWELAPMNTIVHEIGKPLDPENCDVIVYLSTVVQDTFDKGVVGLDGKKRTSVSVMKHAAIFRIPLVTFQTAHMRVIRGETIQ
jgi:hypothetical protein